MSTSPEDSPQSLYQNIGGRDILPIILDPSQSPVSTSALLEQVNQEGGLLVNPGVSAALLSMSGYGKPYADPESYDDTNPANMYLAYSQQGMNPPHLQGSYARDQNQTFTNYSQRGNAHAHAQPETTSSTWEGESSPQIPEVISWSPKSGLQGTKVYINLRSAFAIDATTMNLQVKFGSAKSPSLALMSLKADGTHFQYALHAEVPSHQTTAWATNEVPVTLVAHDHSGNVVASLKLDDPFSYSITTLQESPVISRKRRLSDTGDAPSNYSAKRMATMPVKIEANYGNRSYAYDQQNNTYMHSSPSMNVSNPLPSAYGRSMMHNNDLHQGSPTELPRNITSMPASQHRHNSPHSRSWSSSNLSGGMLTKSPSISNTARSTNSLVSSSTMSTPRLVRTSQISQSPSPATTPSVAAASGSFNPYAMYPHKAQLKISGDLDSMTQQWTTEERDVKRRLVQFWRTQTGSAITASFAPVSPEDRQPNAICISCIWWEAKDQYFVTSVDTIFLLESLVAVRFTVEEKNRIRRNLEGFRPMTVSKGKADSEDFFKLIMGFPNPKPRNIEKDVKVYSWKILTLALKKIIGKYSASYSSVASSLPPSMSSYHSGQDRSSDIAPASPHSTAASALSMTYHSPMTATTLPADISQHHNSISGSYTSSALMPSTMAPAYSLYSYPQAHSAHSGGLMSYNAPQQTTHQAHTGHHPTSSWDSGIGMQQNTGMAPHSMYSFGTGSQGVDHYQMTQSTSGS